MIQVLAKRFKGDAIGRAVLIYLILMFVIIVVSILAISRLDWGKNLKDIFKI